MLERTVRGFPVMRFRDEDGQGCSIQDSSLAEADCIWLGRGGSDGRTRMHIDQEMAEAVLDRLRDPKAPDIELDDFYGSRCVARSSSVGDGTMEVGPTIDFDGHEQRPMRLSKAQIDMLAPLLATFVEIGTIEG